MSRAIANLKNFEDSLSSFHGNVNGTRGRRRNSLAANLHANHVIFGGSSNSDVMEFARRRLSNVSDVVSRKLSRTIGWKPIFAPVEETVSQSSALCAQYIRNRLKRSGIYHRKLGLKRMRSSTLLPDITIVKEACPVLIAVGTELEKEHPNIYVKIGRQVGCGCFSDYSVGNTMTHVSREIIRHDITWSKIIAIYAVAGGISVDCVRQGKPEFLPIIHKVVANIVEKDLALWIETSGGWSAFVSRYRLPPKTSEWNAKKLTFIASVITPIFIVLWIFLRLLLY
ncbi:bcl-2-related ovarian killer protein-like isoform X4 [Leptopilina heterotoma]|uniref:bcl-2-related ovarian killer protein-like isoform X3 n=1 Tax=Leptopilina heterotoma TaxID=63436 RepID=UPI001CA89A9C|nr:bcl-2-related ovarian killer protein-like isoform X3 [Leptopilina heterotoma]XP_043480109.1 bcl-2-related ovarian killer protein-like isoform X4 [Leptopilina heterotoma]